MVAAAVIGSAVVGAAAASAASSKSSSASNRATKSTIAEQQREYDQTRSDNSAGRGLEQGAVSDLQRLYGRSVGPDGTVTQGRPDASGFLTSPGYQFNLQQGQQAIDRSAAARGGLLSGAAVKSGERFASGLASNEYNNYVGQLMQQAGLGQNSTNATSAAGANAANNISGAYLQNGANQGQSAYMMAGGVNQAVQGGASNYLLSKYLGTTPAATQSAYAAPNYNGVQGLDQPLYQSKYGSPFDS